MTLRQGGSLAMRVGAAALLCGYALGQGIPATPPTSPGVTAPVQAGAMGAAPTGAQEAPAARPEITYENGKLTVAANGAGLNQILRQIQRKVGLKITGGVKDERVYGSYGPGEVADDLDRLLDGTGSNMMLVGANGSAPAELILTARQGGPTPPSPSAMGNDGPDERPDRTPQQTIPIPSRGPMPPTGATNGIPQSTAVVQGAIVAPPSPPPVTAAPATDPNAVAPTVVTPATPATTDQQSPNGVKTPQQVYQQLLQMQQKSQQQAAPQK